METPLLLLLTLLSTLRPVVVVEKENARNEERAEEEEKETRNCKNRHDFEQFVNARISFSVVLVHPGAVIKTFKTFQLSLTVLLGATCNRQQEGRRTEGGRERKVAN